MANKRQDFISCLRAHSQEHIRERRSQEGGIKGRMSSLRLSFAHHETSYPERTYLFPHERTALHLGSETLKLFLCIFSLLRGVQSDKSLLHPRASLSTNDIVCGPPPPLRGPGLHKLSRALPTSGHATPLNTIPSSTRLVLYPADPPTPQFLRRLTLQRLAILRSPFQCPFVRIPSIASSDPPCSSYCFGSVTSL